MNTMPINDPYINEDVVQILQDNCIDFDIRYVGETKKQDWGNRAVDYWQVTFTRRTGQIKAESFDYFTGTGLRSKHNKPVKPVIAGVLHSLLLDADACNQSWQDWCSDFGYDADSVSAFNLYNLCAANGRKLYDIIPRNVCDTLRELLQDY
jgi:hypothetical protein